MTLAELLAVTEKHILKYVLLCECAHTIHRSVRVAYRTHAEISSVVAHCIFLCFTRFITKILS